jgi:hypothetical protein
MTNFNYSTQQQYSHYPQNDGHYPSQRQQAHRVLYPDNRRPYFGGFDAGSGFAELWVAPADNPEQVTHAVIPSWVASGCLDDITKRSHLLEADPAEALEEDEFVIAFEGEERYAGRLAQINGTNPTNALNDPRRYANEHAITLLFALAGLLIPEDRFTLRYVTAIPVSLYDDQRRKDIQDVFTRNFQYLWNGHAKNGDLVCGAVVPEGTGALMLYGDTTSKTLVVDYGYRTADVLSAVGQKIDFDHSAGFSIGVGQIVDAFNDELYKFAGRRLDNREVDTLLRAYVHSESLPIVKSHRKSIDPDKIRTALDKVFKTIGKQANTEIARIINEDESGEVAAAYDLVIPIGGGAYHFRKALETMIPNVEDIEHPQSANPEGYLEIAIGFSEDIWSKVVRDVAKRTNRITQHA